MFMIFPVAAIANHLASLRLRFFYRKDAMIMQGAQCCNFSIFIGAPGSGKPNSIQTVL